MSDLLIMTFLSETNWAKLLAKQDVVSYPYHSFLENSLRKFHLKILEIPKTLSILKFMKIDFCHFCLFVCLFVCPFFSPPSCGPISNLITFLVFLHHGSANKIVCSPVEAKIKKKLARKLFFSSRNVFLYVTEFFLYVTYRSKCQSKDKFHSSM